jgi:histidinol phosphatase-like enzyme
MNNIEQLTSTTLAKTWIFDLDGTLVKHNGYKIDGHDTLLQGVREYLNAIPSEDKIIILTSRTDEYKDMTLKFLEEQGIRYDEILFNMPYGERIVVNDRKPSGLDMAIAVNIDRDCPRFPEIERKL